MQDLSPLQSNDSMIGKMLVASTTVNDPLLSRSVCLVVHQDSENVFGVLLNRPMTPPAGLAKLFHAGDTTGENRRAKPRQSKPTGFPANLPEADPAAEHTSPNEPHPAEPHPAEQPPAEQPPAEQTVADAAKALGTIHFGGPLSGPVVAVHNSSAHAEAQAGKGVYVAAQRELLERLVRQKPGPYRLIVGHLGWSVQQLRAERDAGFWHVIDATDEDVFTGDQALWPSVIRRATTASVADWLGIPDTPFAAEVN